MILANSIEPGQVYQFDNTIVRIVSIEDRNGAAMVNTTMDHLKTPFCDTIEEVAAFLNENNAKRIN